MKKMVAVSVVAVASAAVLCLLLLGCGRKGTEPPTQKRTPLPPSSYVEQPVDEALLKSLTDQVISGGPREAREALAALYKDDRLLVEGVFVLLPRLNDVGEQIETDGLTSALWNSSSPPPNKGAGELLPRRPIVLDVLSHFVYKARPGPRRNAAQLALLSCVEAEYRQHPSEDLLAVARNVVYMRSAQWRPANGAEELLAFVQRLLDRQSGRKVATRSELSEIVRLYILNSVPKEAQREAITQYAPYFEAGWSETMKRWYDRQRIGELGEVLDEKEYWALLDMTPEQLAEVAARDVQSLGETIPGRAAELLTATREDRRRNFDLLLPLLRKYSPRVIQMRLFPAYCKPIPKDAPADERQHQDILIDILENLVARPGGYDSATGLDVASYLTCLLVEPSAPADQKIAHPYGKERVVALLGKIASTANANEAEHAKECLRIIAEALPEAEMGK